jgi:hypothetical protein
MCEELWSSMALGWELKIIETLKNWLQPPHSVDSLQPILSHSNFHSAISPRAGLKFNGLGLRENLQETMILHDSIWFYMILYDSSGRQGNNYMKPCWTSLGLRENLHRECGKPLVLTIKWKGASSPKKSSQIIWKHLSIHPKTSRDHLRTITKTIKNYLKKSSKTIKNPSLEVRSFKFLVPSNAFQDAPWPPGLNGSTRTGAEKLDLFFSDTKTPSTPE